MPWPLAVSFLIRPLDDSFVLADVYAVADPLRFAFPTNNHIEAKIRQSLQVLRDRGHVEFEGRGRYRKLVADVRPSVRLDFSEAARYASRSQIARVAVEAWAAANVRCSRCTSTLLLVPTNTKLLDAVCRREGHQIQIKGVAGPVSDRLVAAAHAPIARRLEEGPLPDYLLVSYDRLREAVLCAEYILGNDINASRVHARAPLSSVARRAGWVGATIDLSGLRRSVIVGPSLHPEIEHWSSPATIENDAARAIEPR